MLDVLLKVEAMLPYVLLDRADWRDVFVNYHPPFVERLWMPILDTYRVYLHRIHPCDEGDALFHPHPWPSAMLILEGTYDMAIGYGSGDTTPPIAAKFMLGPGSRYEMTDPDAWHYVRPIGGPSLSVMVTGQPWNRTAPGSNRYLPALSTEQRDYLFTEFGRYY